MASPDQCCPGQFLRESSALNSLRPRVQLGRVPFGRPATQAFVVVHRGIRTRQLNLGLGGFLNPNLAVSARIAGVTYSKDGLSLTAAFFGPWPGTASGTPAICAS